MVTWNSIMEELGEDNSYRAALVRIFRKYEGQETDEKDGRGTVKVTAAWFAKKLVIPVQTFADWVNPPPPAPAPVPAVPAPIITDTVIIQDTDRPTVNPREVLNIPDRPHRPEPTEVEKKETEAQKAAFVGFLTGPIDAVVAAVGFPCAVGTLGEAVDALQGVFDRGDPCDKESLKEAYELLGQYGELLMKLETFWAAKTP